MGTQGTQNSREGDETLKAIKRPKVVVLSMPRKANYIDIAEQLKGESKRQWIKKYGDSNE